MLIGLSYFREQFLSENNIVVALKGPYEGGNSDKHLKAKDLVSIFLIFKIG